MLQHILFVGQETVSETKQELESTTDSKVRLQVQKTLSIEEVFEKVKDYDIVFTSEAAMMSALNDRLEKPVLGHFAVTPMIYTFSKFQNEKLLQERDLFIEIVESTDLTWKQSSYLLENVIDCWKNKGSIESIKDYDRFDTDAVEKIIEVIRTEKNVFTAMQGIEISGEKDVAVVNFHQFNEIDKQILPEKYDKFEIFKEEKEEINEFKVYNSATEIVRAVTDNISQDTAQDTAIVLKQDSSYSNLIESALKAERIPFMRQDGLSEDENLRTFIQFLRLSLNSDRKQVKDCQPVLRKLGIKVSIKKNNDYLKELDSDKEVQKFKQLLEKIGDTTVKEALNTLDSYIETGLEEDFEELGILDQTVSQELLNRLEYYLDTYTVEKDSKGNGVLLANSNSSAIVDRPIVFYLGMDSSWTPNIPNKPWIDRKEEDENNLNNFKALIQNGEQQHYLVQDKKMNEDVTPCLYFNEFTSEEFESFRDLSYERYQTGSKDRENGFEKEDYRVEADDVELFSQSSLNTFVKSPKEYLFDRVTDSSDQDYFRKGTLYHDFAEFYANHKQFVENEGDGKFVEIMLEEMTSIVDELELEILETEFKIGLKNIKQFVDRKVEETELEGYSQKEEKNNFFAEKFDKKIKGKFTEAWFENKDLGVKGIADLIMNKNQLADYKSGKKNSATSIVKKSNLELLEDDPSFQAMLYLAHLRKIRPEEKLKFTFFHFLDNIEDEVSGQAKMEDNIVTITYHPKEFNEFVQTREVFDYIMQSSRSEGKVGEGNARRKTLEIRSSYEVYRKFFESHDIHQFDEDKIEESEIAEKLIQYYKQEVGDYGYVEEGCKDALGRIVKYRKENYFKNDIDRFEDFVQKQLELLNKYRETGFPVQNPEIKIDAEDLDKKDLIPQ